jgi:hypothetical protein
MLFEFNKFWKVILITSTAWIGYALWGFEFSAITLLALILHAQLSNKSRQ